MDDTSQLVWGLIFGSIGFAFFIYGKKQRAIVPLVAGIALCVFPYFVSNVYMLVFAGIGLMALPYFVKI
jgi:hypothetical protein